MKLESFEKEAREFLREKEEILLAYLYGSAAKNDLRRGSDIDLGVLVKDMEEKDPLYEARLARRLKEKTGAEREIDVRTLNGRKLLFLHQVLKYGKCIFSRDEKTRVEFETRVMKKYADFKPKIKEYNKERSKRLKADG